MKYVFDIKIREYAIEMCLKYKITYTLSVVTIINRNYNVHNIYLQNDYGIIQWKNYPIVRYIE